MDKPSLSIVIPLYNEFSSIENTIREVLHHIQHTNLSCEIVLIDDGSTDDTWYKISDIAKEHRDVRCIKFSRNFGKEAAITAGLEFASGDAVIIMDGDLQHPPELIPEMTMLWRDGYDIVEAVKKERAKEPISSRAGARLFYWLMRHLTDLKLDNSSDFKLLDRKVIDVHNRLPERTRFFRGIVSWLGFRRVQIPFQVKERDKERSRWSFLRLVRLAIDASTAFSSLPLHLVTILGLITFVFSIILGIQTLYMKFSGHAVSGFTTVILLLLFIGSVLMLSLGIIGIYISRIFEEIKGRPTFIVEDTVNFR